MEIRSKAQFFDLWKKGVLGNRTLLWDTLDEARRHKPALNRFGFREIGKAGGGSWALAETVIAAINIDYDWAFQGKRYIIDGSVPNDHSTLQGEICRTYRGFESYLAVGYGLPPMRRTMAAGMHKHRGYLESLALVERFMDPSSRDDLDALLELYPEATIEFTCFDIDVGVIPGRNTIFWETRNY